MPTAAASGSGEPPERSDYDAQRTLPRSGLLEPSHAADRPAAPLRAAVVRPLMFVVRRLGKDPRRPVACVVASYWVSYRFWS
jgi:hypothetical protein